MDFFFFLLKAQSNLTFPTQWASASAFFSLVPVSPASRRPRDGTGHEVKLQHWARPPITGCHRNNGKREGGAVRRKMPIGVNTLPNVGVCRITSGSNDVRHVNDI